MVKPRHGLNFDAMQITTGRWNDYFEQWSSIIDEVGHRVPRSSLKDVEFPSDSQAWGYVEAYDKVLRGLRRIEGYRLILSRDLRDRAQKIVKAMSSSALAVRAHMISAGVDDDSVLWDDNGGGEAVLIVRRAAVNAQMYLGWRGPVSEELWNRWLHGKGTPRDFMRKMRLKKGQMRYIPPMKPWGLTGDVDGVVVRSRRNPRVYFEGKRGLLKKRDLYFDAWGLKSFSKLIGRSRKGIGTLVYFSSQGKWDYPRRHPVTKGLSTQDFEINHVGIGSDNLRPIEVEVGFQSTFIVGFEGTVFLSTPRGRLIQVKPNEVYRVPPRPLLGAITLTAAQPYASALVIRPA